MNKMGSDLWDSDRPAVIRFGMHSCFALVALMIIMAALEIA